MSVRSPFLNLALLVAAALLSAVVSAAPRPAFTYQSMLNIYFDDTSGLIRIMDMDLAFAPEGQINAAVALVDANNTVVQSHKFYPDPRWRETVFARLVEVGPADFTPPAPGIYNVVFLVDGQPVSRLPVRMEETSAGDDPFNPQKTYGYSGMWQAYGFLTTHRTWKEEPFPELNLWLGVKDLAEGARKDMFVASLTRDGKTIAHSRETLGHITNKHYQETRIDLYHPHTRQQIPNAQPFVLSDWTANDGSYALLVNRRSDGQLLRRFEVVVEGGKIRQLAATELGFEPQVDYMVPRVIRPGANRYEFIEAIWLQSK